MSQPFHLEDDAGGHQSCNGRSLVLHHIPYVRSVPEYIAYDFCL